MASVVGLPIPLILLVHLHLVEYPSADNSEYDQNLFDPNVRGLRDRTKSMEDMCYFLVGKVEGRKESAKAALPTYPCRAPQDTTAFRTSLAKYLEGLRQNAIYGKTGSRSADVSSRDKGKNKEVAPEILEAWWWKDVVVRKSLLEECAGERFERLLLSLSTHAVLKCTSGLTSRPVNVTEENATALIRTQPHKYTTLLLSCQSNRHTWERSALLLKQRKDNLMLLRENLTSYSDSTPSKYAALTTDRLLALTDSKLQDLSQDLWRGIDGRHALDALVELAGLKAADADPSNPSDALPSADFMRDPKAPTLPVQPLLIAAAHHPSSLRKLRGSIFVSPQNSKLTVDSSVSSDTASKQLKSHPEILLSARLDAEKTTKNALQQALSRARRMGEELQGRLIRATGTHEDEGMDQTILNLNLWQDNESRQDVVDYTTKPTPELLSSVTVYNTSPSRAPEPRIGQIRSSLLPAYPAHGKPASEPLPSCLPQLSKTITSSPHTLTNAHRAQDDLDEPPFSDRTVDPDETPKTPHQLITSTPPASVKPRSAYARRVLASHKLRRKDNVEFVAFGSAGLQKSRKSVRMSMAFAKRPSLFGPLSDEDDEADTEPGHESDVNRIVDAVYDESTSFDRSYTTPKITRLLSPYKGKSGSTFKKSNTTPGPRPSFKIVERLSLAQLPDGMMSDDQFHETHMRDPNGTDDDWTDDDDAQGGDSEKEAEYGDGYDGKSVNLREILLQAGDTAQYDLLEDDEFSLADESTSWE